MTNYIFSTSRVSDTGHGLVMGGLSAAFIGVGVNFGSSVGGGNGILANGNDNRISVAGALLGEYGAYFAGSGGFLSVTQTGAVMGAGTGAYFGGAGAQVENAGTISAAIALRAAESLGLHNSGTIIAQASAVEASGVLTLTNSGLISAGVYAVAASGGLTLVNSGHINGQISGGGFGDSVTNLGTILGDLSLVDGDDLYDGPGGRVVGQIDMGAGDDTMIGGTLAEIVFGREGQDSLATGGGDDRLIVSDQDGSDDIDGGGGQDTYDARGASAAVYASLITGRIRIGGNTDDVTGVERVWGGAARDALTGDDLANGLAGGGGNDTLVGQGGADRLSGGLGADLLQGGDGNDRLLGGDNVDTLQGGAGDDVFTGGYDVDVYTGDAGADRFVWTDFEEFIAGTGGLERITDFTKGQDRIDLSAIDARFAIAGDQGFVFKGTAALTDFGQLNYRTTANATFIAISYNSADAFEVIRLDGVHALTAADFVL